MKNKNFPYKEVEKLAAYLLIHALLQKGSPIKVIDRYTRKERKKEEHIERNFQNHMKN